MKRLLGRVRAGQAELDDLVLLLSALDYAAYDANTWYERKVKGEVSSDSYVDYAMALQLYKVK